MSTLINNIPDINFAEKDVEKIKEELLQDFQEVSGRALYSGDPLRILLLAFAKYLALLRNNIDLAAKQNLLKYAEEGFIENIGALIGVERLEASKASTTLKFSLSKAQQNAIIIPKGTRASPVNKIYFATLEDAEIPAGKTTVTVRSECTQAGSIGNNFQIGEINKLVDIFGYFVAVENITASEGGADKEDIENFRERIVAAPESFSTAGPAGAYEYWTKTANQDISDVSVVSPRAGEVEIYPLLKNGVVPSSEILGQIKDTLEPVRPLTDKVVVLSPEIAKYDIELKYYISKNDMSIGLAIQENVQEAVNNFVFWQKEKLGRDINPSKLIQNIMGAGVKRIELEKPEYTVISYNQIAAAENINIIYGGAEDD